VWSVPRHSPERRSCGKRVGSIRLKIFRRSRTPGRTRLAKSCPPAARHRVVFDAKTLPHPVASRNLLCALPLLTRLFRSMEATMNGLIYLIGLIVVIMAILSFFGLR